jgi:MerR family mercuric resistance operon transcriptional regulator
MKSSGNFTIGALSDRTGCNIETIRYYERAGVLPEPGRSAGGYRLYEAGHVNRLSFIRRARALGFTLDEVRTLLELAEDRRGSCAEARAVAAARLRDVRARIADLRAMERVLSRTVVRCADGTRPSCPLIEALSLGGSDKILATARPAGARKSPSLARAGLKRRKTA